MDERVGLMLSFDLDDQRDNVANSRMEAHRKWCDKMLDGQRLNLACRRVALKILVNEAFQRDVQRCRKEFRRFGVDSFRLTGAYAHERSPKERLELEIEQIKREWHQIAMCVLDDMEHFDLSSLVLKNLSCMCVFIPDSICREYGDNTESRQQRMENMREIICRLQDEGKLFLDEPVRIGHQMQTPQRSSNVSPSLGPRGAFARFEDGTQALDDEDFGEFVCPPTGGVDTQVGIGCEADASLADAEPQQVDLINELMESAACEQQICIDVDLL